MRLSHGAEKDKCEPSGPNDEVPGCSAEYESGYGHGDGDAFAYRER
ncbi:hypothetical protein AWU68_1427 [Corynebacterium simulans]|uniref:Uncharacterized protein n=1 Tax=Corynebacterium simulans TaxID=146827 RepID=A0ABR5VCR2_9CORY|nr:hypothetical protein WM42_1304 [Corynebacterium simulans]AMO91705.1 hypothetical protein AWU68_1427 [Corynebacterium simulans]KXU19193.1 hypothetical protein WM41_0015 [Corynebacterium simulans]